MDRFDHILNWKLKVGSHKFPGRDGGTCINEAALVAAGFEYKRISRVDDMPPCFSRPICRLAMRLNDEAGDEERQRLLPFVTGWPAPTPRRSSGSGRLTSAAGSSGRSASRKDWRLSRALWPLGEEPIPSRPPM